jgi:hypothetical protein
MDAWHTAAECWSFAKPGQIRAGKAPAVRHLKTGTFPHSQGKNGSFVGKESGGMSGVLTFPPTLPSTGGIPAVEPQSHTVYQTDFPVGGTLPAVKGEAVKVRREPHPANTAREYTYWHMVTEDDPKFPRDESKRLADLVRLCALPRAKTLLDNHTHDTVKRWWNVRAGFKHLCIWHPPVNHVLVLKERYDGHFLVTSYCPELERKLNFHKEWAAAKKAGRTF